MATFDNNTRKQAWFLLLVAMFMWMLAGMVLMTPDKAGVASISNPVVLGSYFGVLTAVMLPIGASAYKSYSEKKLQSKGLSDVGGDTDTPPDGSTKPVV